MKGLLDAVLSRELSLRRRDPRTESDTGTAAAQPAPGPSLRHRVAAVARDVEARYPLDEPATDRTETTPDLEKAREADR